MTVENLEIKVKTNAGTAAKKFDSLANSLDRVGNAAKSTIRTNLPTNIKKVGEAAKKATAHTGKLRSSLARIAMYRALRTVIKEITDAFVEGMQNAYAFSSAISTEGHRFSAALDSMSSAGLKMKNQLGSALISLLTALEPLITSAINLITKLADAMSQLFAIFTGGTYLKAMDVPKKWATAAGGAAKKAKEWKNQLLGFDEINRLEEPSDTGGGGGSGEPDVMSMFEDTPINGIFAKIKAKLDELRDSLNFEPLRASWDRLKESIRGLADTILQGLAWAWDHILVPLSHWTIEKLAPELVTLLANAFNLLNKILRALAPYFEWFWENVLKPCFTFIGNIAIKVLQTFNGLLEKLAKLVGGEVSFKEFIKGLSDSEVILGVVLAALGLNGLIGLLMHLKDVVLVGVFLGLGKLATALSALAANPIALVIAGISALIIVGVMLYRHWDEIIAKVKEFQQTLYEALHDGKLNWLDFVAVFVRTIMAPIEGLVTLIGWIKSLCEWIASALQGLNYLVSNTKIAKKADARAAEIQNDGSVYLEGFASGGFPTPGQLFVANEAGPELVGTMGGRTAVAPQNDIVEGIRQGVYDAVTAANSNGERQVDVRVYLDSREIKIGQNRLNRALGV